MSVDCVEQGPRHAMLGELGRVVAELPGVGSAVVMSVGGGVRFVDSVSTPMPAVGLAE